MNTGGMSAGVAGRGTFLHIQWERGVGETEGAKRKGFSFGAGGAIEELVIV